jgi:VIT1/CCC1 family predicted Fe2+/Mn2+ transporter
MVLESDGHGVEEKDYGVRGKGCGGTGSSSEASSCSKSTISSSSFFFLALPSCLPAAPFFFLVPSLTVVVTVVVTVAVTVVVIVVVTVLEIREEL